MAVCTRLKRLHPSSEGAVLIATLSWGNAFPQRTLNIANKIPTKAILEMPLQGALYSLKLCRIKIPEGLHSLWGFCYNRKEITERRA